MIKTKFFYSVFCFLFLFLGVVSSFPSLPDIGEFPGEPSFDLPVEVVSSVESSVSAGAGGVGGASGFGNVSLDSNSLNDSSLSSNSSEDFLDGSSSGDDGLSSSFISDDSDSVDKDDNDLSDSLVDGGLSDGFSGLFNLKSVVLVLFIVLIVFLLWFFLRKRS